ncbi:MAG: enoyl-CoA hydratase/isomerase family protein [Acidobacteriota bacterium]
MSSQQTIFETRGPIATLTFNRPEARNAMTWEMYQALVDACDRVDDDPAIRVWVLRGAGGKAFIAGTDIKQFEAFRDPGAGIAYEQRIDAILDRLERVAKPTIAQVQGFAVGGGCAIALMCDLRVATPDSRFGIPIARTLGNCLSGASCSRLVDLMGPALMKDLLFSGRLMDGTEAHAHGLVTRLEPGDTIEQAVEEYAARIAGHAPLTIRATKETVRRILAGRRLAAGEDHDLITMCYNSSDFREGVEAFLSKRAPRWTGE